MLRFAALIVLAVTLAGCAAGNPTAPAPAAITRTASAAPVSPPAQDAISEIHMFDALHGWGWSQDLGGNSRLMVTDDGGLSWADRSPVGYAFDRQGASFLDAAHAWLPTFTAAAQAGLLRTSDAGQTWSAAPSAGGPYMAYDFRSATDGIASGAVRGAGNADVRFYETHDGGMSWDRVPVIPQTAEGRPAATIHICSICGDTVSLSLPGRLIVTHGYLAGDPQGVVRLSVSQDLGRAWNDLRLPMPSTAFRRAAGDPDAPKFFDDRTGVLPVHIFEGRDSTSYSYRLLALYSTRDGGQTWSAGAGVAADVQVYEPALDVVSPTVAIVRCGDSLCTTTDQGQTWTMVKPDLDFGEFGGERQLIQIDFIDPQTGWAVIDDDDLYQLYKTTDGGATWRRPGK